MEACGGSHHWARVLTELGHEVKLMSPQLVKPYVKGNKNDYNDAEGICEAVGRPNMRFVTIKDFEQQDLLVIASSTAMDGSFPPALAWFQANIPRGINRSCLESANGATSIFECCSSMVRDR